MLQRLLQTFEQLDGNSDVKVIILQAAGPVFCSGHDLKEMTHQNEDEYRQLFELCSDLMQRIRRTQKPVIAKVHALATAAGCQLVAACDLAVATNQAAFATPGVKIGLFCTTPMVPLVRAIPPKPAMEMLLTGKPITAQRAYELGLINFVGTEEDVNQKLDELVDSISESSSQVIAIGKEAFYDQLNLSEPEAYERACQVMTSNAMVPDANEGISAFLEKRKPEWSGN
jgi:enoyl-CoA hydratase/carnithine racemase